jgi:putative transposase
MPRLKRISDGPIVLPKRWPGLVDGLDETRAGEIETCIHRSRPFGDAKWTQKMAVKLSLESSLRPPGRPKKEAKQ